MPKASRSCASTSGTGIRRGNSNAAKTGSRFPPRSKAVREYDDYYVTVHDACGNDISSFSFLDKYRTDHMLEYTPVTPSAEIRITATDEYGRQLFTVTTKAES